MRAGMMTLKFMVGAARIKNAMASSGTRILDRFIFSCFGSPENFIRDPCGPGYF
jgi:hypothetical protein